MQYNYGPLRDWYKKELDVAHYSQPYHATNFLLFAPIIFVLYLLVRQTKRGYFNCQATFFIMAGNCLF